MLLRPFLAFVLMSLLAAPILRLSWIPVERWQIRHAQKEALESQALETLTLSTAQVVWLTGDEISYQGQRFDVKAVVHLSPEKMQLTGIFDEKENALDQLVQAKTSGTDWKGLVLHLLQLQSPQPLAFFEWAGWCWPLLPSPVWESEFKLLQQPRALWVPPPAWV